MIMIYAKGVNRHKAFTLHLTHENYDENNVFPDEKKRTSNRKFSVKARSSLSRLRNRDNVIVKKGSSKSRLGGDTGLRPSKLYYCGRQMNQCRCGGCDGICGPTAGCPCNACLDLIRNRDKVAVKKGLGPGIGGDTGLHSTQLYYCGRRMNQCRCGRCDGVCGPNNGCPCNACLDLVMKSNLKI
jgi:hypothetical protein